MSRRTFFGTLLWAAGLASLLALLTGERQAVSVGIWLAGFSGWLAFMTLLRLLDQVPLFPVRLVPQVGRRPKAGRPVDRRPRDLRSLEGLLIRARDHDRAHTQQLQPKLWAMAEHFLPRQHGVNPVTEPERAATVLGDVAWLIDKGVVGRTPTVAEVARFVDILCPQQNQQREEPR